MVNRNYEWKSGVRKLSGCRVWLPADERQKANLGDLLPDQLARSLRKSIDQSAIPRLDKEINCRVILRCWNAGRTDKCQ